MNALTAFLLLAVILIYLSFLFLLPIFNRKSGQETDQNAINIRLYKDKLHELVNDLEDGSIDKQQYINAEEELKKQLLEDTSETDSVSIQQTQQTSSEVQPYRIALALVLFIPALTVFLYFIFGQPKALTQGPTHLQKATATNKTKQRPSVEAVQQMIVRIKARLKQKPNDPKGWIMLARAYTYIQQFGPASDAYQTALKYNKDNPDLLASYADVLTAAYGGKIAEKSLKLILKALKLDPNHPKALNLAGTAYYQSGNYKQALVYWSRLHKVLPPGSQYVSAIEISINEVRKKLGMEPIAVKPIIAKAGKAFVITGIITVDQKLKKSLTGKETVFIVARAVSGSKFPIALLRKTAADLPLKFQLDDNTKMSPRSKLSNQQKVIVFVRILRHGGVKPQKGDLESEILTISRDNSKDLKLTINKTVK